MAMSVTGSGCRSSQASNEANPARLWLTRTVSRSARAWPSRQRATTCVRPPMSIPTVTILGSLLSTDPRGARSLRSTSPDGSDHRSMPQDPDHRSRPEVGGRTLGSTVICRIGVRRSPRGGRRHHRPHKAVYQALIGLTVIGSVAVMRVTHQVDRTAAGILASQPLGCALDRVVDWARAHAG